MRRRSKVLVWLNPIKRRRGAPLRRAENSYHLSNKVKTMKKRLLVILILLSYSAILIKVMVFKDLPLIRIGSLKFNFGGTHVGAANFLPFKTILRYLCGEQGLMIGGINLVGNIALLVPIGFLVPFVYRKMTWKETFALAIVAGFAIEGMQAVLRVGIFDVDDVILNGLGVIVGYWAFTILTRMVRSMKSKKLLFCLGG